MTLTQGVCHGVNNRELRMRCAGSKDSRAERGGDRWIEINSSISLSLYTRGRTPLGTMETQGDTSGTCAISLSLSAIPMHALVLVFGENNGKRAFSVIRELVDF